jgi:hypothetical protein
VDITLKGIADEKWKNTPSELNKHAMSKEFWLTDELVFFVKHFAFYLCWIVYVIV